MVTRKILASSVIALLLALFITGDSLASFTGNRLGKITNVSTRQITFTTLGGTTKSFLVASSTRYFGINGVVKSFADLSNGRFVDAVGLVGFPDEPDRVMSASTVILLPSTIKTAEWNNARDYGKVTSVNKAGSSFVLNGRFGSVTYKVNGGTDFISNVSSLNGLQSGMRALIAFDSTTKAVIAIAAFTPQ